jgi:hypothetical protein
MTLHGFEPPGSECLHFVDPVAAQVGQLVLFHISPNIFGRVKLGRVAGQIVNHDLPPPVEST